MDIAKLGIPDGVQEGVLTSNLSMAQSQIPSHQLQHHQIQPHLHYTQIPLSNSLVTTQIPQHHGVNHHHIQNLQNSMPLMPVTTSHIQQHHQTQQHLSQPQNLGLSLPISHLTPHASNFESGHIVQNQVSSVNISTPSSHQINHPNLINTVINPNFNLTVSQSMNNAIDNSQQPLVDNSNKSIPPEVPVTKENTISNINSLFQEVKKESREEIPSFCSQDVSQLLKTDDLELTTGKHIVEEANKIFNCSNKNGPKVSMAFRVVKKIKTNNTGDGCEKKKKRKKEKRVKVVFMSKKKLVEAMKAAENGQDPQEVMSKLNEDTQNKSDNTKEISSNKLLSKQSLDQTDKKLPDTGVDKTTEKSVFSQNDEDPDYFPDENFQPLPKKKLKKKDYGDDDFIDYESDYDDEEDEDEFYDGDTKDDFDSSDERTSSKRRNPKKSSDTKARTHRIKRNRAPCKNTLDKTKGFYSMNLDDYVVDFGDSSRSISQRDVNNEMSDNIDPIKDDDPEHISDAKIYGCVYCDYTGRKQNWLIHLRTKHKDRNIFFCSRHRVCAMPFNTQELLDQHTAIAHKMEHVCPTCNKVYRYPSQLNKHMQSHLSDDSEEKRKHICPYCGKKFSTRSGYRSHEAHYHTKDLRHKCDWEGCDKAYFSLNDLKIHKRGHTGELPFTCSYCGTGFVAKCRLVQHEKVIHLKIGKQKVECEICHKMIRQKHMSFHLKTHQGLTTAWCSVCGKGFPSIGGKRRHEKIHFNIKNYACRFCGKAFVQKANMEAHERIHTGVKPYSCKYCGECFVQGTRRNQHQNSCRHKPVEPAPQVSQQPQQEQPQITSQQIQPSPQVMQ